MKKSAIKTLSSIVLAVIGLGLFLYGNNLSDEAAFKEERLSQAEASDQRRPTLGPVRRAARTQEAENKQEMLNQAGQRIASSETTANWLQGLGIALLIAGIGSFVFFLKAKRH